MIIWVGFLYLPNKQLIWPQPDIHLILMRTYWQGLLTTFRGNVRCWRSPDWSPFIQPVPLTNKTLYQLGKFKHCVSEALCTISFWLTNLFYEPRIRTYRYKYRYTSLRMHTKKTMWVPFHKCFRKPSNFVSISPATKRICNQPSNGTYQGGVGSRSPLGNRVINGRSKGWKIFTGKSILWR